MLCFGGKSVVVVLSCDFPGSNILLVIIFFSIPFSSGDNYVADDTAFPVFLDESKIENLVKCTGKTEIPTEQLLHSADQDKVLSQKETLSKCKVHTRKSDDSNYNNNSYVTSDSNVNILPLFSPQRETRSSFIIYHNLSVTFESRFFFFIFYK